MGGRTTNQGYSQPNTLNTLNTLRERWATYERDDETGLDYAQARYYSSAQGRFTSPDEFTGGPVELYYFVDDAAANPTFYADLTNPQSLNKYQYTYNNPLRYNDPTGHCVGVSRPICEQLARAAGQAASALQRGAERAAPYVTGAITTVVVATSDWARSGNTAGDPSCQGCASSERMGQHLMGKNKSKEGDGNQNNSGEQGDSSQRGGSQSGEGSASGSNAGGSSGRTPHGEERKRQADSGDAKRQVGDANRVIRDGRKFRDTDSGNTVHVSGNRVVVVKPDGKIHSQFTNPRKNTQKRIRSGKWEEIKKED